eukprot:TRINITY_DN2323_c0_g3_i4.p1 TRINITY_DN2323_c0_g3~~TRINITY_DN2323_c0_g3_i4.p1  ORF type:complete len:387 (-),score=129.95 TRINITY_DN2323_c0_g3_i4:233-1393(-)
MLEIQQDKIYLENEQKRSFERGLFHKLFYSDVLYLSSLKSLWVATAPPVPLKLETNSNVIERSTLKTLELLPIDNSGALLVDQKIWNLEECVEKFMASVTRLKKKEVKEKWDKDDPLHLDFVTAAANIRAAIFHLELSSRFVVKEKAGSIIPAIATTNAIIAGLVVMKAFRVLDGKIKSCTNTWLKRQPTRGMLFVGSTLDPPNSKCYVCGDHFVQLKIDTKKTKLKFFLDEIVGKEWDLSNPILSTVLESGTKLLYEKPEEDDEEDIENDFIQREKFLSQIYMTHDSIVYVSDQDVNVHITVSIVHQTFPFEEEKPYLILGGVGGGGGGGGGGSDGGKSVAAPSQDDDGDDGVVEIKQVICDDDVVEVTPPRTNLKRTLKEMSLR